jgi:hypothetical protein
MMAAEGQTGKWPINLRTFLGESERHVRPGFQEKPNEPPWPSATCPSRTGKFIFNLLVNP